MYIKRKKYSNKAYDNKISMVCDELIEMNPDVCFAVSKKFIEGDETEKLPIIISSAPLSELKIPSSFDLIYNDYLTNWCDNEPLVRLVHSNFKFIDGEINGNKIERLYLDLDHEIKSGGKRLC